jgi:primary-amine oxidase
MAHPLDQLSPAEIKQASRLCQATKTGKLAFNTITLQEPPKALLLQYYNDNKIAIARTVLVIAYEAGTANLVEFLVNLDEQKVISSVDREGVCPIITLEDLQGTEAIVRLDPGVKQLCKDIGITDMSKVYCDAWTIGFDERWGTTHRLQQALMYYRASPNDNAYAHPLDFCPIVDMQTSKVIEIDVKLKEGSKFERAPVPLEEQNYMPEFVKDYRSDVKPIHVTQPEGVSFELQGQETSWLGWKMHIGFNAREGIVLNNIRVEDPVTHQERSLFHRLSIAEMVVPYGCPTKPHHRKHAWDVGEYGCGAMTNSLTLGCDCKVRFPHLCKANSREASAISMAIVAIVLVKHLLLRMLFAFTKKTTVFCSSTQIFAMVRSFPLAIAN